MKEINCILIGIIIGFFLFYSREEKVGNNPYMDSTHNFQLKQSIIGKDTVLSVKCRYVKKAEGFVLLTK
jgi:hypothetical protein